MLVNLINKEDNESYAINIDYIVNLYVKSYEDKWILLARLIDGTMLPLMTYENKCGAIKEYDRIIEASSIHKTQITNLNDLVIR